MKLLPAIVLLFLLGGCALTKPPVPPSPTFTNPVTQVKPPAATAAPGSLWSSTSDGIFADLKARRPGDILTIAIYEQASASKEATTSTGRNSSAAAGITDLFGLQKYLSKMDSSIDPSKLIGSSYENDFKGSGSTSRKEDLVATLTARVVEVMPTGNLKIAGRKTVTVNREEQLISLTGFVRPTDISSANIIDSQYILDAQISYTGKGIISDKQGQGWLTRSMDTIWPF